MRFEQTAQDSDLDAAIAAGNSAVEATPPTHQDHASYLSNFALAMLARSEKEAASSAIATAQAHRALEMLEHGRSVLWTEAPHARSDLTRLHERAPELADRLDQIRGQLNHLPRDTELNAMSFRDHADWRDVGPTDRRP